MEPCSELYTIHLTKRLIGHSVYINWQLIRQILTAHWTLLLSPRFVKHFGGIFANYSLFCKHFLVQNIFLEIFQTQSILCVVSRQCAANG